MKYDDLKVLLKKELSKHPDGIKWKDLKAELKLPYKILCPEWTKKLEEEIGLNRKPSQGRGYLWSLS